MSVGVRKLVIVNGRPRAGKDSVVEIALEIARERGARANDVSSIDPVREMLRRNDYPVDNKTPAMRDLLAAVGAAVQAFDQTRTNYVVRSANHLHRISAPTTDVLLFAHLREPELIEVVRQQVAAEGRFQLVTVLVRSTAREEIVESNTSDAGVLGMPYDVTLHNEGTLEELRTGVSDLVTYLLHSGAGTSAVDSPVSDQDDGA